VPLGLLTVTLFLQEVAGFSAFEAGLATVPVALMSLFFAQLFGGLAGRFGHRLFVTVGPAIAASGYLVMLTGRDPLNFWLQLLPGLLLFGLGLSVTVAPLTASILGSVDSRQSGIASAINNAVSRVAGLVSIAFISVIVGQELDYDGFHRVVVVVAVLFLIASVISRVGIPASRLEGASIAVEAAALCHDRTIPVPVASLRSDHENR
jgi:MFS family permease